MKKNITKLAKKNHDCPNHELARLASVYAMPPHLREHDTSGAQLPRHFPREQMIVIDEEKETVVEDSAKGSQYREPKAKTKTIGLKDHCWQPMEGEFTVAKRIEEIDTAIELLEEEKVRLRKLKK